ncbi:MAG TPA: ATP-binding protein [Burkholderiales bacterium]|nr:ATP-binding protein [Burkholderiales bacterium]
MTRKPSSPRQLALLLALSGIAPLAIVATVLLVALWRTHQAQLVQVSGAQAQVAAAAVEHRVDATIERLRAIAAADARTPDAVWLPPDAPGDQPHRARALAGEVAVSGRLAGGAVEVAVPVFRDGRLAYVLAAPLSPAELAALLQGRLRGRASAAIIDAEGAVIAGEAPAVPLQRLREQRAGAERLVPDTITAWRRVSGTGWSVVVTAPRADAEAALARELAPLAALLVAVLVASGFFAWLAARRLAAAADETRRLARELEERLERTAAAEASRARADAERARLFAEEQRARRQAEAANRAKDEFLAMLGHELRNPLGAIGNALRVLERLPSSSADHKAAREIIGRQTEHLAKIVDDLLDVGRLVSGRISLRRHLLDLAQAAAAAVGTARAGSGAAHEWQVQLAPVLVSADPTRIDQVLANLLANAVTFTPSGGCIGVRLEREAGEAVLTVEDNGPGIRPDLLPYVFELFARDVAPPQGGGLGLGLTLVRRLVELHGGSVSAANRPDGGARFVVRLPAIPDPEPAERRTRPLPSPRPARQARVLIVEDNDDARVMLQRVLQAEGHLVSAASDAKAGLEAAMAGSPNLAVIDIGLPGMDGYELARALRERLGSGVRLVALTGYGTPADRQRAGEAGFDAHLTKPVDFERLLGLIAEAGA